MNYGEKVRNIRKTKGMSATKLAEYLGVSQPTISQVENGQFQLSDENTLKMAILFELPVAYFIDDNYVSLDELDLNNKTRSLLEDDSLLDYIVIAGEAKKEGISAEEFRETLNFLLKLKKGRN